MNILLRSRKWNRSLNYWKDRNISGPKPVPYFGNTLSHFLKPRPYVELEWYNTYGRLYGVHEMGAPVLVVADPVLIKQILVKDFHKWRNNNSKDSTQLFPKHLGNARDDHWKRFRHVLSPGFTLGKLKRMYPLIDECCQEVMRALDRKLSVSSGQTVDVQLKPLMTDYTMDVIASTAFATKTHTHSHPNNPFVANVNKFFVFNRFKTLSAMILPTFVTHSRVWKAVVGGGGQTPIMFFTQIVKRLLSERKKSGKIYNDLLQLLIDSERVDINDQTVSADIKASTDAAEAHRVMKGIGNDLAADEQVLSDQLFDKTLTEEEIINQCVGLLIAGVESTALTLSLCTYELALNPDIQNLLVAEIKEAFNENTADIDYETLWRLPLLDAVVSETVRKYPQGIFLRREASETVVLSTGRSDGSTVTIEKGMFVSIPVYGIHHDPDNYPDPLVFKPDRFLSKNSHHIKPYTYLPFGAGPRNCIAMRLALFEVKLLVAKMIQQFRFYAVADTPIPPVFEFGFDLLNARSLVVGVAKR
ncbi:unnamed protein product [Medioppia subpectinata]|uniref:Cytochrome P450 n=1 Tax=Medioppia subpectinata TaxID=1979941 RepID=A0A7R9KMB8_9ACAR|nr:unnamed protein product [Medioppia subpectinata]CAG2105908.1 unnamed protein product [Medioppia subpectinata]